ncbi:hypothetical protein PMIT1342_01853 [Prochlorococcus marinus str. MIT 1342]|uniref:glycosyltransferase n=1 Tax=Prochlorococcus TaxID=1218 RepID=UPI0007BB03EB|nr:hypothetical protein [Prochlorococcus marinus]KZR79908.1 hypothetical protein PMIT1342_01853 [Prochlorococcus marinus str. MIT 1342]
MNKKIHSLSQLIDSRRDNFFKLVISKPYLSPNKLSIDPSYPICSSKDWIYCLSQADINLLDSNIVISAYGQTSLVFLDINSVTEIISSFGEHITHSYLIADIKKTFLCPSSFHSSLLLNHLFDNVFHFPAFLESEYSQFCQSSKSTFTLYKTYISFLLSSVNHNDYNFFVVDESFGSASSILASCLYNLPLKSVILCADIFSYRVSTSSLVTSTSSDLFLPDTSIHMPTSSSTQYLCQQSSNLLYKGQVTAVINLYRRFDSVVEIINSLHAQTVPASNIIVWINQGTGITDITRLKNLFPSLSIVYCEDNLGVWARFAYSLNNLTEYTVVFDDDTIPGNKWIENCLREMTLEEALYGTVGLIFRSSSHYMDHDRHGWPNPNTTSMYVDIVGHSWFFRTSWLRTYWQHKEYFIGTDYCGEDMHFSYALQLLGIPTKVPPHPADDMSFWGSTKGAQAGSGDEAISVSGKGSLMDYPLQQLISSGFRLINQ